MIPQHRLLMWSRAGVSDTASSSSIPARELGRVYADELGRVNQVVAEEADHVYFMAAGLPLELKTSSRAGDTAIGKRQPS